MTQFPGRVIVLFCIGIVIAGMVLPAGAAEVSVEVLPEDSAVFQDPQASPAPDSVENAKVRLSALPLTFIPNQGQYEPAVVYVVTGPQSTLRFTSEDIVIIVVEKNGNESVSQVVRQTFPGASTNPLIIGTDQLPGTANFFHGNDPSQWQTNVPTYNAVEYHDLYPGIDLRYKGTEGSLKREFVVSPGANPSLIRLRYDGVDTIAVDESGALVLITNNSTLTESPLICYQEIDGLNVPVNATYRVISDREVTFMLGQYDPTFPLVIDPRLGYSTFLGGSGLDEVRGIAVDSSGNAYVTGHTFSMDFPTTTGAYNRTNCGGGYSDVFVTKLAPDGSTLVYSTFLGGISTDRGLAIAVDSDGTVYLTGSTNSADFPTTWGAFNRTIGGSTDVFVTKLNQAGSDLVYSTFLGGSGQDTGLGIAADRWGNAYVAGDTYSTNFPTTPGAYSRTVSGSTDVFVTKLDYVGGVVYSTFLGGAGQDNGRSIATDSTGNAYVTGGTDSSDFPTTTGAYNRTSGGSGDGFVTKLNSMGSDLIYSTYLGGSGGDGGRGIAVDGSGNAYVTGNTASADFPSTGGAYDQTYAGSMWNDVFVTKLNTAGSGLVYSTYIGGTSYDDSYCIAIDGSGNAYVTGDTSSSDFPTTAGAYNRTKGGSFDVFVTKLNTAGSGLVYSTYLGGEGEDVGTGIAVDSSGYIYVTGGTDSSDFPVTGSAYDTFYNATDVFIAKFSLAGSGIGVFRPSIHSFILKNGTVKTIVPWGLSTDTPVAGDWNGDGMDDVGVYRPSIQKFILKNGTERTVVPWGLGTDTPVTGDWNGNGMSNVGVYRPSIAKFILKNGTEKTIIPWGLGTDIPVAGDWNGDGFWDVGVYRPSIQKFILKNGTEKTVIPWGLGTDTPVAGDWNGDGMGDVGVYRPPIAKFILKNGTEKTIVPWGMSTDIPATGRWS